MALDGITIANVVKELREALIGGRIYKIAQPEKDELLLTIKQNPAETGVSGQKRLFLSASASLPLIYLTDNNKPSPLTAPVFCMLLRKHLQNGRITAITQPGLERIVQIHVEHLNELGDLCRKKLIVELMGKHSNIIFANEEGQILDSIKHISGMVSSVREVLPGRTYFIPQTGEKKDPLATSYEEFSELLGSKGVPLYKAVYGSYTGLSPVVAQELCDRAGLDGDISAGLLKEHPDSCETLYRIFSDCMEEVIQGNFFPVIYMEGEEPVEFSSLPLKIYCDKQRLPFDSISALLEHYYAKKNVLTRIRQKSADLRRIVQTALERNVKKYDLQIRQMQDTEKRETYRVYGELLNIYGYGAPPQAKSLEAVNYHTNETVIIPLDPTLTTGENAKKYFDKYTKMKRTMEALSQLTIEVKQEIAHLESIANALDMALLEEDLVPIKEELTASGYVRRKGGSKREKIISKPFHYLSSNDYHIYVGKNNYQNEELTFQFAAGNDWWFHAKGIPGSHVIVKRNGTYSPEEKRPGESAMPPDATFEEAASLAAYYSKGRGQEKVEVDYTEKKNIKKPGGGKPGFVVYDTNYSMVIAPKIDSIRQIP